VVVRAPDGKIPSTTCVSNVIEPVFRGNLASVQQREHASAGGAQRDLRVRVGECRRGSLEERRVIRKVRRRGMTDDKKLPPRFRSGEELESLCCRCMTQHDGDGHVVVVVLGWSSNAFVFRIE